jgi:hypothetical protein
MRPPGPRADSKSVTEIPFFASVDAHTAPDTATFIPFLSAIFSISKHIVHVTNSRNKDGGERHILTSTSNNCDFSCNVAHGGGVDGWIRFAETKRQELVVNGSYGHFLPSLDHWLWFGLMRVRQVFKIFLEL